MPAVPIVNVVVEREGERWEHLRVRRLSGREVIGQLSTFDVELACDRGHDPPDALAVGEELDLVIEIDGLEVRRVHGLVATLRERLAAADRRTFALRLVPRAARLGLVETQEIFLDLAVPDVVRAKLERLGLGPGDFDLRLLGTYAPREIVVQWRESDLAFVSRLCEHVGISLFVEQEGDVDRLVFTDHPGGFRALAGAEELPFQPAGETGGVFALEEIDAIAPTAHIVQDYNYRTPLVDLTACVDLASGHGGGVVEFGAHVKTPEEAAALAAVRADERRSRQRVVEGKAGSPLFTAGARVRIADLPGRDAPEGFLLEEVRHELVAPTFGEASAEPPRYACWFRAVPEATAYRPPRVTPRPSLPGVVTGVVQPGPCGEEGGVAKIDADGRYTIALHLDTAELGATKASHPMRMSQPFAGQGYGMHFPLRPGTEVLVAFTNGDPDRPIILGATYNATWPNPVVAASAAKHQIRGSTGAIFEFVSKT